MNEVLNKYKDNCEMLLKILKTMYGEYVEHYNRIATKFDDFSLGEYKVLSSILDYFDLDFLEMHFEDLYIRYGKGELNE